MKETGKEYVIPINNEINKEIRKYIEKALKVKPKVNKDGSFTINFGVKYSEGQKKVN